MQRVGSGSDGGHGHLEHVPVHDLRNRVVFVDEFVDEDEAADEEQRGRAGSRDTAGTNRRKTAKQSTPHPKVRGQRGGDEDGEGGSRRTEGEPSSEAKGAVPAGGGVMSPPARPRQIPDRSPSPVGRGARGAQPAELLHIRSSSPSRAHSPSGIVHVFRTALVAALIVFFLLWLFPKQQEVIAVSSGSGAAGAAVVIDPAIVQRLKAAEARVASLSNELRTCARSADADALRGQVADLRKSLAAVSAAQAAQAGRADVDEIRKRVTRLDAEAKELRSGQSAKETRLAMPANSELMKLLDLYFTDRTGMPDYALHGAGGAVVAHSALHSSALGERSLVGKMVELAAATRVGPIVHPLANEWLLGPGFETPGHCLALNGTSGFVDVKLRQPIELSAVSLEHLHRLIAFDMGSAPRQFRVSAWMHNASASAEGPQAAVGNFTYNGKDGLAVQTFKVAAKGKVADRVRLEVLSNHGNPLWTCLYRFRVHGKPINSPQYLE